MAKYERGLLDTSAVIDLEHIDPNDLPDEGVIAAITLAELAAGPRAVTDPKESKERGRLFRRAEMLRLVPFDASAAHAYGLVYGAIVARGRKARGARAIDLLIAATALASGLPLFTCNPADFEGLDDFLEVVPVKSQRHNLEQGRKDDTRGS